MEPLVRYVRTPDRLSIAYSTIGEGLPVLYCPGHTLAMRYIVSDQNPGTYGRELAARTEFTIFDYPGIGASQRDVRDFSLEGRVHAIEAVAAELPHEHFTLIGANTGAAGAAMYAAKHPDRVRELACVHPAPPSARGAGAWIRDNWSLARRRIAGLAYPDGPVSAQRWYSLAMRESMSAHVAAAYVDEYASANLNEIFRRVPVRTLFCVAPVAQGGHGALQFASLVTDCQVVEVSNEGIGIGPAILEFMGVATVGEATTAVPSPDLLGTVVILFTDIVDSTALIERMGDTSFRAGARQLDARLRSAIRANGGSPVEGKVLGDGVMGIFPSATQAIAAARACADTSVESEIPLHIGLHAGDVIREPTNVYGGAVNIAARICALAAPGEVLVSRTVADLARTSAGATFEDRGEHALKGIAEPQRVFAVRTAEAGS